MNAQKTFPIDTAGFETFTYEEDGETVIMKQYFFCIYTKGDQTIQDKDSSAALQAAHRAHMGETYEEGKLCIAGPFGDDSDWRGLVILSVRTEEEARAIMEADPAVQRGTLGYIIKPSWMAVGSSLH